MKRMLFLALLVPVFASAEIPTWTKLQVASPPQANVFIERNTAAQIAAVSCVTGPGTFAITRLIDVETLTSKVASGVGCKFIPSLNAHGDLITSTSRYGYYNVVTDTAFDERSLLLADTDVTDLRKIWSLGVPSVIQSIDLVTGLSTYNYLLYSASGDSLIALNNGTVAYTSGNNAVLWDTITDQYVRLTSARLFDVTDSMILVGGLGIAGSNLKRWFPPHADQAPADEVSDSGYDGTKVYVSDSGHAVFGGSTSVKVWKVGTSATVTVTTANIQEARPITDGVVWRELSGFKFVPWNDLTATPISIGPSSDVRHGGGASGKGSWDVALNGNIVYAASDGSVQLLKVTRILVKQVEIDIKPGSDTNCVNVNGHGVIPVAILGSEAFSVTDIDPSQLSFGGLDVRVRGNKGPQCSMEDTNLDGYLDLICQFEDNPDYWTPGEDNAVLSGELFDGTKIEGSDTLCVVP